MTNVDLRYRIKNWLNIYQEIINEINKLNLFFGLLAFRGR